MLRSKKLWVPLGGLIVLGVGASVIIQQQNATDLPIREGKLPPVTEGKCPVDHTVVERKTCPMASHEVDALVAENQMPPANQQPHHEQKKPLPTNRIRSSIPRGAIKEEDKEKWEYPSEQMFYNALRKKGWEGVNEDDIPAIVAIHNTTNERAWAEVLRWEIGLHGYQLDKPPRLEKFRGKYKEISPKARLKMFFQGVKRPFDRHDWIVNRDGKQIRYIIDFYDGAQQMDHAVAMHLDVRPAMDSFGAFWDRLRMFSGFVPTLEEVYEDKPHLANRMTHE